MHLTSNQLICLSVGICNEGNRFAEDNRGRWYMDKTASQQNAYPSANKMR